MVRLIELLAIIGFSGLAFIGIQIVRGGKKSAVIVSIVVSFILLVFNAKLEEDTGKGLVGTAYCSLATCKNRQALAATPYATVAIPEQVSDPNFAMRVWLDGYDSAFWNTIDSKHLLSEATARFGRVNLIALADSNHARAAQLVGRGYNEALSGFQNDLTQAVKYYTICADSGNARCQNNLGGIIFDGYGGVGSNPSRGIQLTQLAADQGLAAAYSNLGRFHEEGKGVPKDLALARQNYQAGADLGFPAAMAFLGHLQQLGTPGYPPDIRSAQDNYRRAADLGDPSARYYLGLEYEQGRGEIVKNVDEAIRLYRLAASAGNQSALERLRFLNIAQ